MTAEELIIGHYEKTLTGEQESSLAAMVAGSPDVRGLFEQHGNIHGLMADDAAAVQPSSKLDKVVLTAALGTLAEIAGHSIGFSLLGKVASVIGAIAVGGVGVVLFNNALNDDDAQRREKVPATVQRGPDVKSPASAIGPTVGPVEATVANDSTATKGSRETNDNGSSSRVASKRSTASSAKDPSSTTTATTAATPAKRPSLNADGKPTDVLHPPKIEGNGPAPQKK